MDWKTAWGEGLQTLKGVLVSFSAKKSTKVYGACHTQNIN